MRMKASYRDPSAAPHLGVVCSSGLRVALKVIKAVTREKRIQIPRNRIQCSFIVK